MSEEIFADSRKSKVISVSKKRQITIPLEFYDELKLGNEVECLLVGEKIVIQPLRRDTSDFSVEILKDLLYQGYSGKELLIKFEEQSKDIKGAIEKLREEADAIAAGEISAANLDEVFDSTD
jgi:bifunctional DNA-binding transcriptional regulator/antitoxin component of YhaV-PrlF toxin-antitoxin module